MQRIARLSTLFRPREWCWRTIVPWLAIALLLSVQIGLLRHYARRQITWAYPANYDQVQYLWQSYDTYAHIQADGWLLGLRYGLQMWAPQGMLIHVQASLLFMLLGPARLTALTLNFIYFVLFQVTLVWTLYWLTRRWEIPLIGLGLLLAARSPFLMFGGLMDFRIDFIALCLFGMLICLVIRSGMFVSRRWSLAVGALAILLVFFRFLTATYLVGIFGAFGLFLSWRLLRTQGDRHAHAQALRRLGGLALASGLFLVAVLPTLWYHREQLWSYYGVGHLVGEEKNIRARAMNISNIAIALLYYPGSVVVHHTGAVFLIIGTTTLATTAIVLRDQSPLYTLFLQTRERQSTIPEDTRRYTYIAHIIEYLRAPVPIGTAQVENSIDAMDVRAVYIFLTLCLLVPYTILTLDVSKSPVVGNVFLPVVLWLIVFTAIVLSRALSLDSDHPVLKRALPVLAALSIGAGMLYQYVQFNQPSSLSKNRSDTEQVLQLHDLIFQYSREHGLIAPRVSSDHIVDYINANIVNVVIYERHGVFFRSQPGLGTSILAIDQANAIEQIRRSDFVVLSTPRAEERLTFPFDILMESLHPQLVAICDQQFAQLGRFQIANRDLVLYAHRD